MAVLLDVVLASPLYITLLLLVGLGSGVYTLGYKWQTNPDIPDANGAKPPRPHKDTWLYGIDKILAVRKYLKQGRPLDWYRDLIIDGGPTFALRILSHRDIVTSEPRNIEAIMHAQHDDFQLRFRERDFGKFFGPGIFVQDGAEWRHSRNLLKAQFRQKRAVMMDVFAPLTEKLIDYIPRGEPVDLQNLFQRYTFDLTTLLFFGKSTGALEARDRVEDLDDFNAAFIASARFQLESQWLLKIKALRYDKPAHAKRTCFATMQGLLDNAKMQREKRDRGEEVDYSAVYMDDLLDSGLDDERIKSQMLHTTVAGRDSTSALLAWVIRTLALHPEVLKKLRAEIKAVLGDEGRMPSADDLKKIRYLSFIIKEVLRFYPPIPVNTRKAEHDTSLPTGGGTDGQSPLKIKKDELVSYPVFVIHRNKALFGEDADEFRPERWDPETENAVDLKHIAWGYMPFNAGMRICPGQELAQLEVSLVLVRLFQRFSTIEQPAGAPPLMPVGEAPHEPSIVVHPVDGEGWWVLS